MDGLIIRLAKESDKDFIMDWLSDENILQWFPMTTENEIADAVNVCMGYIKSGGMFVAEYKGEVCGMTCLYLPIFQKFTHQCLFVIVVKQEFRSKGVGSALLRFLMKTAKETFNIKLLHLEVYSGNPARSFYERFGFKKYGLYKNFVKLKNGSYTDAILMQKDL